MAPADKMAARYSQLRNRLESKGYREVLPVDALPLVEKLLNDFMVASTNLEATTKKADYFEKIAQELESGVEPFKEENVRLIKENSELRLSLLKKSESVEEKIAGTKLRVKDLEAENKDLKQLLNQFVERVRDLELDLEKKTRKILILQERNLEAQIIGPDGEKIRMSTKKQTMEISSAADPHCNHCVRIRNCVQYGNKEKEPGTMDYIQLADSRIEALQLQLRQMRKNEMDLINALTSMKAKIEGREHEIVKLRGMVQVKPGGIPKDSSDDPSNDENVLMALKAAQMQLNILQLRNLQLEKKLQNSYLHRVRDKTSSTKSNIGIHTEIYPDFDTVKMQEKVLALEAQLSHCCSEKAKLKYLLEECENREKHFTSPRSPSKGASRTEISKEEKNLDLIFKTDSRHKKHSSEEIARTAGDSREEGRISRVSKTYERQPRVSSRSRIVDQDNRQRSESRELRKSQLSSDRGLRISTTNSKEDQRIAHHAVKGSDQQKKNIEIKSTDARKYSSHENATKVTRAGLVSKTSSKDHNVNLIDVREISDNTDKKRSSEEVMKKRENGFAQKEKETHSTNGTRSKSLVSKLSGKRKAPSSSKDGIEKSQLSYPQISASKSTVGGVPSEEKSRTLTQSTEFDSHRRSRSTDTDSTSDSYSDNSDDETIHDSEMQKDTSPTERSSSRAQTQNGMIFTNGKSQEKKRSSVEIIEEIDESHLSNRSKLKQHVERRQDDNTSESEEEEIEERRESTPEETHGISEAKPTGSEISKSRKSNAKTLNKSADEVRKQSSSTRFPSKRISSSKPQSNLDKPRSSGVIKDKVDESKALPADEPIAEVIESETSGSAIPQRNRSQELRTSSENVKTVKSKNGPQDETPGFQRGQGQPQELQDSAPFKDDATPEETRGVSQPSLVVEDVHQARSNEILMGGSADAYDGMRNISSRSGKSNEKLYGLTSTSVTGRSSDLGLFPTETRTILERPNLSPEWTAMHSDLESYREEIKRLRTFAYRKEDEIDGLRKENQELERRLRSTQIREPLKTPSYTLSSDKEMEREINSLKFALKALDRDKDEMRLELDKKDEKLYKLQNELTQNLDEIGKLQFRLKNSELQLGRTSDTSRDQEREMVLHKRQLSSLRNDLEQVIKERDDARKELRRLGQDHSVVEIERRNISSELVNRTKEADDLKNQVQKYIDEVRRIEDLLQRKEEEYDEILEHYRALSAERTTLESTRVSLERETDSMKHEVREALAQNTSLKTRLASQDSLNKSYEDEIERLAQRVASLEIQLNNTSEAGKSVESDAAISRDLCLKLENNLSKLRLELANSESSRAATEAGNRELQAQINKVEEALAEEQDKSHKLEELIGQIREKEFTLQKSIQDLLVEKDSLTQQCATLKSKWEVVNQENEKYRLKCTQLLTDLEVLQRQLVNEKGEKESAKEELKKIRQQLSTSSTNILLTSALGRSAGAVSPVGTSSSFQSPQTTETSPQHPDFQIMLSPNPLDPPLGASTSRVDVDTATYHSTTKSTSSSYSRTGGSGST